MLQKSSSVDLIDIDRKPYPTIAVWMLSLSIHNLPKYITFYVINKSEKNKKTLTYTKNVPGAAGIKLEDNTKKITSIIPNISKLIT